jgi:YVTN family beta-propeller protein
MRLAFAVMCLAILATSAAAQTLPNGMLLSPQASPGADFTPLNPHLPGYPNYTVGQAVSTVVSPDGKTLLILTSGFNLLIGANDNPIPAASSEYVFVENISNPRNPVQTQALQLPNTYMGIAFAPDGKRFYVSGGVDDDVHVFDRISGKWAELGKPIALNHGKGFDPNSEINAGGIGLGVTPQAAGLAVTADGKTAVVANFENDSASLVSLATGEVTEIPLRPGAISKRERGKPGGEYPFGVAIRGNDTAYVSSLRDREIDVLAIGPKPALTGRIPVPGNTEKLILNKSGSRLYVACDNADIVAVIDTRRKRVMQMIRTLAPPGLLAEGPRYRGAAPNALALSPDEHTLYVTNGGTNTLAVINLSTAAETGLIPTGYQPNDVSVSHDGGTLYIVNGKSIPGPDPGNCTADPARKITPVQCDVANQYILELSKAGFLVLPTPNATALAGTTKTAAVNDHFKDMPSPADAAMMAALHQRITHIIYILRENRTYDEELGDLGEGNGDAALAEFGAAITPNAHAMAKNFVDFDNFYDSGEVSGNGWPWSTAARESDIGAKNMPINYAGRGLSYDWEGTNRDIDIAIPTLAGREAEEPVYKQMPDPDDVLPGPASIAAPDGPQGQIQRGYLWDAALRAGLTVRNYGFLLDLQRYDAKPADGGIPLLTDPFATSTIVAFPANPQLARLTDVYFRGFDNKFPDFYREAEWQREFKADEKSGNLPNLTLLRLMHDHLGAFKHAIDGVNTPETQMADNDYAVGAVIDAVAHSRFRDSTLIFVIEDDAQDGPDHVDAHRSVAYIVGPYVKHHAVISTRYSTVNFLRTMEDILGTGHLSVSDAFQRPMTDVFDLSQRDWSYTALIPAPLSATQLPLPKTTAWKNTEPASYWAAKTAGYDWSAEDRIPAVAFNEILWAGLHHNSPYPGPLTDDDPDDPD